MTGNNFKEKKAVPFIFTQFWSRSHLNKLDRLTPQDVYCVLTISSSIIGIIVVSISSSFSNLVSSSVMDFIVVSMASSSRISSGTNVESSFLLREIVEWVVKTRKYVTRLARTPHSMASQIIVPNCIHSFSTLNMW